MKTFYSLAIMLSCLFVFVAFDDLNQMNKLHNRELQLKSLLELNTIYESQLKILRNYIDKQSHLDVSLVDDKFTDAMGGDAWLKPEYWQIDADGTKHKQTKAEFDKGVDEIFKSIDKSKSYK